MQKYITNNKLFVSLFWTNPRALTTWDQIMKFDKNPLKISSEK